MSDQPTQRERIRSALSRLYRNAVDGMALFDAREALADAQNGPPDGAADGSVPEDLWTLVSMQVEAFAVVQRVHLELKERAGR